MFIPEGGAVVREDDNCLRVQIRSNLVAEGRRGEVEPVYAVSAMIMNIMLRQAG